MSKSKENKSKVPSTSFLDKVDAFLIKRQSILFYISLALLVLYSILLFQANISIGGDDSFYIVRAMKFVDEGKFPGFQGPLYPLVLSPFVAIFGINVHLLKTLSIVFTAVFFFLFYRSYKNKVNSSVLFLSMLILAFNASILFYASQTYTEAFFLMIQLLFIYQFFRVYDMMGDKDADLKTQFKEWLMFGFTMFLMSISKNVGLTGILTVMGFFLIHARWKAAAFSLVSWGGFTMMLSGIKTLFFNTGAQIASQGSDVLYKDPYNKAKGKEDLAGYFNRLIENTDIYLSKNMMKIFQIRDESVTTVDTSISVVILLLILVGLFISFKKNKYIFFTGAYMTVTLAVVFVVLQTRWDSTRLVFLVIPFFCLFMLYVFDDLIRRIKVKAFQPIFFVVMLIYVGSGLKSATSEIDLLTLKKNLSGDRYLGYTTDWQNFLKMSEWSGKNLPEGSLVASRKAGMSTIYANGKKFFNITRVISQDADTLLDHFQENGVTHVILAKLRRNPKQKSEFTINTVHRYLSIIEQSYPGTFRLVHQVGQTDNEEARLFFVNYQVRERIRGFQ